MSAILNRPEPPRGIVLYILEQAGCDHCAKAEMYLQKVESDMRRENSNFSPVMVIRRDGSLTDSIAGWRPKSTPAYALTINAQLVAKHEGVMTDVQLRKWLKGAIDA